ncbi:MAG TPA: hypothetical protein VNT53_00410 [Pseudolysinimonas sp.]|nr:hypothetical protein [Pseudolysinimonas sp.]
MSDQPVTVIVHLRPKPGAEKRILELRPLMDAEFAGTTTLSAQLFKVEDSDEWRDIVVVANREAVDKTPQSPYYQEWKSLVDYLKFEIIEPVTS